MTARWLLLAALLSGCPDVDVHEDRERGVTCWSRIVGSSVAMSCLPDLMLLPRRDGGEP